MRMKSALVAANMSITTGMNTIMRMKTAPAAADMTTTITMMNAAVAAGTIMDTWRLATAKR